MSLQTSLSCETEMEDEVAFELDVYLSKTLAEHLYLFHHPTKQSTDEPERAECLSAKIKPKQQKLELEFNLDPEDKSYDKSRGEQIAINVDGLNPSGETFFRSSVMDKYVVTATAAQDNSSVDNYAVGYIRKGELHITPVHSALELRQNFSYMDKMDNSAKKNHSSAEEKEDEEEEAVAVTVRFEGPNAEKDKQLREKSYQYLQQKNANEPWINVNYHPLDSRKSKLEYENLICSYMYKDSSFCDFTSKAYLNSLIPESLRCFRHNTNKDVGISGSGEPISDQIKQLLINTHVLKFSMILEQLSPEVDAMSVETIIEQCAILARGCWVAKSDLLYKEGSISPLTGVTAKHLSNARDYMIWLFTKSKVITRKDVTSAIYIPDADLINMISQIAVKSDRGWEFKYQYDSDFVENHRSIVNRQELIWDKIYKNLVKELNLSSQKLSCPVPRKQKRVYRSSLSEDGDESETDTSLSSHKDKSKRLSNSPKKRLNISPMKSTKSSKTYHIATLDVSPTFLELPPSDDVKSQLKECVQEAIQNHYVMTLSSLKELISESHLSALCSRNDFEQLIHEALSTCGAQKLKNKWPQNTKPEPLYAFWNFGNKFDRYRSILLELFSTTARTRINLFIKTVEDVLREIISENDSRQIFEEYCVYKSGFFYLKGTIALDS